MPDDATTNRLDEAAKSLKNAQRQIAKAASEERAEHFAYHVNDAIAQATFALTALRAATQK
jgi:GH25 family lysozyme M1 (1,4-beta-N-acetylmuramidase)